MEVAQVLGEKGRWDTYMPVLGNLLRPSSEAGPVVDMPIPDDDAVNESITDFRNGDGATLKTWGDRIVATVFDGYADWAGYYASQPEWVLTNLAQVLEGAGQQSALLRHLQSIANALPEGRLECLESFKSDIDQWVPNWQNNASTQLAGADGSPEGQETVQAYPNTESWNYSRTPGTFYYRYVERDSKHVYVYNDRPDAPDTEWHELSHWDDEAERLALGYGDLHETGWPEEWKGWYIAPVPPEHQQAYGGAWVYGKGTSGPWMSEQQAQQHVAQAAPQATQTPETSTAAPLSPQVVNEIRAVIDPFTEEFMRSLPPQLAGSQEARSLVEQEVRKRAAQILAAGEAHEER